MEILFVCSELSPYSGTTPAADVCAALPKALRGLGHRVTVVSPLYASVDPGERGLARRLSKAEVTLAGRKLACELYDGRTTGGVELVFVGHEELIHGAESLTPTGDADEEDALRAGVFARAAVEVIRRREPRPDAIHGLDWAGAHVSLLCAADPELATIPFVLSIQDASEQGVFDASMAGALGVPADAAQDGAIRLLASGIRAASRVTACSPAYAAELLTEEGGRGLQRALGEAGERFSGVPNGVDAATWNPATDPRLVSRFDPMDLSGKGRTRTALQRALDLPVRDDVPVIGMIATDAESAGFDLFAKIASQVLRNDCQIVAVWDGDPEAPLRNVLIELSGRWPDRMQVRDDDGELAHAVLGAADLMLVPARREPVGFVHLHAQRYGALPIVQRTGSVPDSVVDADASLDTGSGFLFDGADADELLAAVRRALGAYRRREGFEALRRRVMRIDNSWERSARLYERLYRDAATA